MRAPVPAPPRLTLWADTAADLMTDNPVSLRRDATVGEALAAMLDRSVSAAPVIDAGGHAVGVVSVTDILIHERVGLLPVGVRADLAAPGPLPTSVGCRFEAGGGAPTTVEEIMTPGVFTVRHDYPADKVVADLLRLKVHRLFVEDGHGVIVGVISTTDILRRLAK